MSTWIFSIVQISELFLIFLIIFLLSSKYFYYLLAYVYTYVYPFIDPMYTTKWALHVNRYISILALREKRWRTERNHPVYNIKSLLYHYYVIRNPIKIYTYIYIYAPIFIHNRGSGIATISEVSIRGKTRVPRDLKDQIERLRFNRAIFARTTANL